VGFHGAGFRRRVYMQAPTTQRAPNTGSHHGLTSPTTDMAPGTDWLHHWVGSHHPDGSHYCGVQSHVWPRRRGGFGLRVLSMKKERGGGGRGRCRGWFVGGGRRWWVWRWREEWDMVWFRRRLFKGRRREGFNLLFLQISLDLVEPKTVCTPLYLYLRALHGCAHYV
jgi:hypothetical protein